MRVLVVLLLAGCSHVSIDASSNTSSGSATGAQAGVHVESRSLAALVVAGMLIAAAAEETQDPRRFPSSSTFPDWFPRHAESRARSRTPGQRARLQPTGRLFARQYPL